MDAPNPPGSDITLAPSYLIPCGVFGAFALGLCSLRVWSRMRPWPHFDDYLIAIAELLSLAGYCIGGVASAHGWGRLSSYVSFSDRVVAFKCLFAMELLWIHGVVLIRISVAWSLLRLSVTIGKFENLWRRVLWSLIAIQVALYIGYMIFLFCNCTPLRGNWEPVEDMKCWNRQYSIIWGWLANGFNILSDFLLATMPVQIIRTLNRPFREKILISCLMAMGLLATAVATYKMTLSFGYDVGDLLQTTVKTSIWCKLEELIGIIAACLPSLKRPAEELLRRMGVLSDRMMHSEILPSFVLSGTDQWSWQPPGRHSTQVDSREIPDGNESEKVIVTGDVWSQSSSDIRTTSSKETTEKG